MIARLIMEPAAVLSPAGIHACGRRLYLQFFGYSVALAVCRAVLSLPAFTAFAATRLLASVCSGLVLLYLFGYTVYRRLHSDPRGVRLTIPRIDRLSFVVILVAYTAALVIETLARNHAWGMFSVTGRFFAVWLQLFTFAAVIRSWTLTAKAPVALSRRRITLINPLWNGICGGLISWLRRVYPPFFIVLKAHTPAGWEFVEYNVLIWQRRYLPSTGLVAIGCTSSNSYRAYDIARKAREAGATVVMGGPHVSVNPEEALQFCDAVVIGEAESVWEQVVGDFEAGVLKDRYLGEPLEDFGKKTHELLMRMPPGEAQHYVETTRGCKFACEFCSVPHLSYRKVRHQPVERIVAQMERLKPLGKTIVFIDNNIFADKTYADELFRRLQPLKMDWTAGTSIDIGAHPESLRLAYESGMRKVLIGFEVAGRSAERNLSGKFAFVDRYVELARSIRRAGLRFKSGFIYGFDDDDIRYMWSMFLLIARLRPIASGVAMLTPLPGTSLFKRYLDAGRLITLNWNKYDIRHLVFRPVTRSSYGLRLSQQALRHLGFIFLTAYGRILGTLLAAAIGMSLLYILFL